MSRSSPIRRVPALLTSMLLCAGAVAAQSALPNASPTSINPIALPVQPGPSGQTEIAKPEKKLNVIYLDGKLTVDAANASLNQVLREIAQKTGMKLIGSVGDESVFGRYGPQPAAEVLASLLDGTANNMLLVDNQKAAPELILTPRRGGASPPNPNAAIAQNDSSQQQSQQQYVPPSRPYQAPTANGRGPAGANADGSPTFGRPFLNDPSPSGDPQKTPQQIYEQLQGNGAQQTPPQE